MTISAATLDRCWREAHALWDVQATLSPPERWKEGRKGHWNADEPLAYLDLETRQVVVNLPLLEKMKAAGSLTAVLAHEIGHHVRFPHTLAELASLLRLEKRLLPGLGSSLTNLFYDLLVNEFVGRTRAAELCAVYRGFLEVAPEDGVMAPVFGFYLAIYEELWGLAAGDLLPRDDEKRLAREYPGFRADARVFAQTFWALGGVHLQFVYFCCQFLRYLPEPSEVLRLRLPLGSDLPEPGLDDIDAVICGNGEQAAEDALREAEQNGWLDGSGVAASPATDPLGEIEDLTKHMPGKGQAEAKEALVSRHYKRLVDQNLIVIPGEQPPPEAVLPTVLEDWDWSDSPRAIDWTASVLAHGPLAPIHPLKREQEPDTDPAEGADFPAVEIYLDTSGSMPDPSRALNVMTLAAQILAASALRRGGSVRGIVYSSGKPRISPWMYDEDLARRFLLFYFGGGTDYPFDVLLASVKERTDVVRVVVSDSDFLWNCNARKDSMDVLKRAAEGSRTLVAFLAAEEKAARQGLAGALEHPRFRLALVHKLNEFAAVAASLSRALLGP